MKKICLAIMLFSSITCSYELFFNKHTYRGVVKRKFVHEYNNKSHHYTRLILIIDFKTEVKDIEVTWDTYYSFEKGQQISFNFPVHEMSAFHKVLGSGSGLLFGFCLVFLMLSGMELPNPYKN